MAFKLIFLVSSVSFYSTVSTFGFGRHVSSTNDVTSVYGKQILLKNAQTVDRIKVLDSKIASDLEKNAITLPARVSHLTEPGELIGKRIVLDPGHLGGSYAKAEGKYVQLTTKANPHGKQQRFLSEGDLNLEIALVLKQKLELAGAEVFLTRTKMGKSLLLPFHQWLFRDSETASAIHRKIRLVEPNDQASKRNELKGHVQKAGALYNSLANSKLKETYLAGFDDLSRENQRIIEKALAIYVFEDLFQRAHFINEEVKPDITINIHLNADTKNHRKHSTLKSGNPRNLVMGFIPGAVLNGEEKDKNTLEALRYWSTPWNLATLSSSIQLCQAIIDSLASRLNIEKASFANVGPVQRNMVDLSALFGATYKGIFSRNLAMTRFVKSSQCFTEGLYYDNNNEHWKFYQREIDLPELNIRTSQRINDIADALFEGIKNGVSVY